ncbi:phosphatase PAP2 family protein [Rubrivirga sp. S365]|uniref:phosphatase PAP2 family protein n=1 Tax=Rubrivirga sp. S365 TaxID=3076080 RepID=UPI0028C6C390|nr:phosphatase PAP2 family protein [Rubrivirga sp. S365]MDT7856273.1 phosphatase PAP2 family protein [Rubrivirga sp. S365]
MTDRPAPAAIARFLRRRLERGVPYGLSATLAFVAVALLLWGFVEVVDAVSEGDDLARLDARAHEVVFNALGADPQLGVAVTWFGNNLTLITFVVVATLALVAAKRYWSAFRVAFASGGGGLVVLGLKGLFHRARPVDQVIPAEGYSFPSGHAFASTVFYGMLVYLVWRLTEKAWARALAAVVGPLLIISVGLSRVYLNVHFLTDVVAGWLSGAAWLVASLLIVDLVETRFRGGNGRRAQPGDAGPQRHPARTASRTA